jgi:hypothetical protein
LPTIVDSLLVELKLDPSGLKKGQEEATRGFAKIKDQAVKSGKEMEAANKALGEQFSKLKGEALGLFAILLGARGIKDFVANANQAAAAVGRFGQNIGASPQIVYGWEKAVERMGGTADEAAGSLNSIANALWQVHNMGQPLPHELYRLQAGMGEIAATHFDTEHGVVAFMNDVAAQAQKLAAIDPQSAFRLLTGAGISEATANTMIKYGAGMGAYADSIARAVAPTKEAIEDAQHLQDAWGRVRATVDGIGNDAIPALDQALTPLLGKMADFLQRFRDAEKSPEGHSVPIPWGEFWNKTKNFFDIGAHGAELPPGGASPDFDESAFESRRGRALSGLQVDGHDVSRANPIPVDIVRTSAAAPAGDGNGFLGGPIGSGGPLPQTDQRSIWQRIFGGGGAPESIRRRGYPLSSGSGNLTALIDAEAARAGIDPNIMEGIRAGESGHGQNYDVNHGTPSDPEESYGPFQLNRLRGLGVQFEKDTGLDLRDPGTIPAQARWVAEYIKRGGSLSPWRGYHGNRQADPRWGDAGYIPKTAGGAPAGHFHIKDPSGIHTYPAPGEKVHASEPKNAPAWWSGVPLSRASGPVGGARLSSMAASKPVTTSSTSNAFHIAKIDVNAPNATDANGIASELSAALERSAMAMMAQSGQA